MEKTKTPTRKEMFTSVSDFLASHDADAALIDFINHQIDLVSRKSATGEKKLTKEQEQNLAYTEQIFQTMETGRRYSVAELMKELPFIEEYNDTHENDFSMQKFTSLVKPLIESGRVIKTVEKRKTYYTKA